MTTSKKTPPVKKTNKLTNTLFCVDCFCTMSIPSHHHHSHGSVPKSNPKHAFEMFGFFLTARDSIRQRQILPLVETKVNEFIFAEKIHAGNARDNYGKIGIFCTTEAEYLFTETEGDKEVRALLPSIEACHAFVYANIFKIISEKNRNFLEKKARTETLISGGAGGGGGGGGGDTIPPMIVGSLSKYGGGGYFKDRISRGSGSYGTYENAGGSVKRARRGSDGSCSQ